MSRQKRKWLAKKPIVTFFRDVQGRVRRVGKKCHCEVFVIDKYKGQLTPDRKQLHYHVPFPDYDTAVTYVVNRRLGYEIKPPQFGHWIDPFFWKPLCITMPEVRDG